MGAEPDVCAFCGREGDDFVPEHWVSQWISRALIPKHGSMVFHDNPPRFKRYFDLTVPHVCKDCNHHWMSDIETRARDDVLALIPAAKGPPTTKEAQHRLATWCFLKALTLELGRPPDQPATYPPEYYAAFRTHQNPPYRNCSIGLGVRDIAERNPTFVWFVTQGPDWPAGPGHPPIRGYHTTMLIGHLVIDVAGALSPVNAQMELGDGFVVLWPDLPGPAIPWPPARRFTGVGNGNLI